MVERSIRREEASDGTDAKTPADIDWPTWEEYVEMTAAQQVAFTRAVREAEPRPDLSTFDADALQRALDAYDRAMGKTRH